MPFNSSIYTDLELPSLNQDNSTYGRIINTYFQALETKLKNLSDRINAGGVGDSSTLAQINSDIAEVNSNISGILPDPYSGNYTTVSAWPSYNTELTALGLSPPETASEIESFFAGSDITSFVNFLNGKLDSLDTLVATAEQDICIANLYSDRILNLSDHLVWSKTSSNALSWVTNTSQLSAGTYTNYQAISPGGYIKGTGGVTGTQMVTALPSISSLGISDIGTTVVLASGSGATFGSGSVVEINYVNSTPIVQMVLASSWSAPIAAREYFSPDAMTLWGYVINTDTYTLTLPEPDTSAC